MAIQIRLRQGTTTEHNTFKGAVGEVTVDTTKKTVVVHDGVTLGGTVLAKVSEVPSLIPQATETALGVAKIATTSIAQAGTNDTDFITAKKLRGALNATGEAPISACRAWGLIDMTTTPPTLVSGMNISSLLLNGTGDLTITFTTAMPHANYAIVGSGSDTVIGGGPLFKTTAQGIAAAPTLKTTTQIRVGLGGGNPYNTKNLSIGVLC